jgi:superfamily II DNA/RNA helicase
VQVLVVAPSQELAMQISRVAQGLFPQDSRTAVQQAIGGANIRRQAEAIAEHQPIMVVGTPGRVVDLVG